MLDLLIKNGTIIDGTQTRRYRADIAIQADRIVDIGQFGDATATHTIDAKGKIVAPGFIDVHTHSDAHLLDAPHLHSKTTQGFTTELIMLDGISYAPVNQHTIHDWIYYLRALNGLSLADYTGWESIADYMTLLDGQNVQNVATHIPYANVRTLACGFGARVPNDYQMGDIQRLIQQGMEEGAVGLSTGLDYADQCFATTDELVAACQAMASYRGIYVTHVRYALGTLAGVKEAVEIGKRAGVPVHISHLKGSNQAEVEAILSYIDQVAIHEVDFSFDVYPYVPSSTMLQYLLPLDVWRDGPFAALNKLTDPRLRATFGRYLAQLPLDKIHIAWTNSKRNSRHQGETLAEYIATVKRPPADALCDLLIEEGMAVLLVFQLGDDKFVEPFLAHSHYMMGSDGILMDDGPIHPRQYGSAPRLLGRYVRQKGVISLEDAIYKLSGFPATRFGLQERGEIRRNHFADITIFDADTIIDRATYSKPHQNATGVTDMIVNGVPVIVDEYAVDPLPMLPGRWLR